LDHQTKSPAVGFDSDCIDLRLSGPGSGEIDSVTFREAEKQRQLLKDNKKKFVLAQPPHVRHDPSIVYKQVINIKQTA